MAAVSSSTPGPGSTRSRAGDAHGNLRPGPSSSRTMRSADPLVTVSAVARDHSAGPTEDLDFFTSPELGHVPAARDALEAAARERGWRTERIHDSDTFCRLVIRSGTAETLTDFAVDAPPDFPASLTSAGPTLAPEELASRPLRSRSTTGVSAGPPHIMRLSRFPRWPGCSRGRLPASWPKWPIWTVHVRMAASVTSWQAPCSGMTRRTSPMSTASC